MKPITSWRQRVCDEAFRARGARHYRAALAKFELLAKLEPDEPSHVHHAAELHARLREPALAVAAFVRAARLYVRGGFAARALAVLRLARPLAADTREVDALHESCARRRVAERERAAGLLRAAALSALEASAPPLMPPRHLVG